MKHIIWVVRGHGSSLGDSRLTSRSAGSTGLRRPLVLSWLDHIRPLDHILAGFPAWRPSSPPPVLRAPTDTSPEMLLSSPLVPLTSTSYPHPPPSPSPEILPSSPSGHREILPPGSLC